MNLKIMVRYHHVDNFLRLSSNGTLSQNSLLLAMKTKLTSLRNLILIDILKGQILQVNLLKGLTELKEREKSTLTIQEKEILKNSHLLLNRILILLQRTLILKVSLKN